MAAEQIFFLNPLNRDFVLGRTPQPYRAPFAPLEAGCAFLFFTPFVLAGIAILVMAIASWYQFAAFSSAAVAVEATVIDKRIGTDSDGDPCATYAYRFATPEGQMLNGSYSAALPKNVEPPLVGNRVALFYADPKSYQLL